MNKRIDIGGIVQGVGFRPFVYQLAVRHGIRGFVRNTGHGVHLEAEGEAEAIGSFLEALRHELPPQARIDTLHATEGQIAGYEAFGIVQSREEEPSGALIPADAALCEACIREMDDPSDRRYRYPFINCTACGPRYTILHTLPYDRVRTSMKTFAMCPECEAEYTNPASRRYHAEPISCPRCGPRLRFLDAGGEEIPAEAIALAASMLKEGKIIALKGVGGFHLMCDATSDEAVGELRRRKRRKTKPLAVMCRSLEQLERCVSVNANERGLITGAIKPIVIADARPETPLSGLVAPGIGRIGVMLPYTPLHRLLLEAVDVPLVATSANISDEPILVTAEELLERLGGVADGILDHDRPILNPLDDSVVQLAGEKVLMLRMGRGYAPWSMPLHRPSEKGILAVGAQQKSAIALALGGNLLLSGHIGDLGSIEAEEYFERTVETFKRFYGGGEEATVHDLHPTYTTTRYALEHSRTHRGVQHHYAHILACMAEYGLSETVLGFAFDGTGYGKEGELWGGEVMVADVRAFERVGSLRPFALLGGERAIREPRRIALSLLFERYSLDEVLAMRLPTTEAFSPDEIRRLHHLWAKKLNAPLTSSMGRLFDAVASLGGFVQNLDYEGQGGLVMEPWVAEAAGEPFGFEVENGLVDWSGIIGEIVALHAQGGVSGDELKTTVASRFIATVAEIISHFARVYPELPVVVGGGVFQNRALMERLCRQFGGRVIHAQQRTPINDGSIALGQAWWGHHAQI